MIGKLRHRIVIQKPTLSTDSIGGKTETWSTLDTVFAAIEPVSANQTWMAERLEHRVTHKITIRYRDDLTSDMRIYFDSRYFYIQGFRKILETDHWSEIMAAEGEAS